MNLLQRQELGFIRIINDYYKVSQKPFLLVAGSTRIQNVISAEKISGRTFEGNEQYPDVALQTKSGTYKISMKGTNAPSIAGGGLRGIEKAYPGLVGRFLEAANKRLISEGYKEGDNIRDVYGKISQEYKEEIVLGTPAIGGPINYIYIGPMNVSSNQSPGRLTLNGRLIDARSFAKSENLYLRLRKRRSDQRFDPESKNRYGYPSILGKSPSEGSSSRIVVVSRPPGNALIVEF